MAAEPVRYTEISSSEGTAKEARIDVWGQETFDKKRRRQV